MGSNFFEKFGAAMAQTCNANCTLESCPSAYRERKTNANKCAKCGIGEIDVEEKNVCVACSRVECTFCRRYYVFGAEGEDCGNIECNFPMCANCADKCQICCRVLCPSCATAEGRNEDEPLNNHEENEADLEGACDHIKKKMRASMQVAITVV